MADERTTHSCRMTVTNCDREELDQLISTLRELGMTVAETSSKTAGGRRLAIEGIPDAGELRRKDKGGRPPHGVNPPAGSPLSKETPIKEAWEWLQGHSPEEGMAALGLKRSTYFRKKKQIQEMAEDEDAYAKRRSDAGMPPLPRTLGWVH